MSAEAQSNTKKIGLYILGGALLAALVLLTGGFALYSYMEAQKDNDAYAVAKAGGTKAHLESYLAQFPTGKSALNAQRDIDDLEWAAMPKTLNGYVTYLKARPKGIYAEEARTKADNLMWDKHGARGSISGLRYYLELFPEGKNATQARSQIDKRLACNKDYAQKELAQMQTKSGLVEAKSDGATNIITQKQGSASSTTHYSGNTATTYYHDGTYSSQDGVEVRYRITNNSKLLVLSRVEGTVSFRTKAGVFWRGLLGGMVGAAYGSAKDPNGIANDGAIAGAKTGYDMAKHSEAVLITQRLMPGETYQGRAYLSAKYKVLNSEFNATKIEAVIAEDLLDKKLAPGC